MRRRQLVLHAYVLMPNHYHLLVETRGLGQRAIGEAFGVSPYAGSKAIARARELAGRRRTAERLIKSLTFILNG